MALQESTFANLETAASTREDETIFNSDLLTSLDTAITAASNDGLYKTLISVEGRLVDRNLELKNGQNWTSFDEVAHAIARRGYKLNQTSSRNSLKITTVKITVAWD